MLPDMRASGWWRWWERSALRAGARQSLLLALATYPPRASGLVHVCLHGVPADCEASFERLLDDLLDCGPIVPVSQALESGSN